MGDLNALLPKSFGSKKPPRKKTEKTATETKEDLLSSFLPTSFGQKRKIRKTTASSPAKKQKVEVPVEDIPVQKVLAEESFPVPAPAPRTIKAKPKASQYPLPISDCTELKAHKGPVISLGIDPSGSRLLSGSTDYHVRFWDFAGMMSDYRRYSVFSDHNTQH